MKSRKMLYQAWWNMQARCYNPGARGFKNYGGRGIVVCDRWRNSFEDFFSDMGECPDGFTLERKDSNKNYEPLNCKWASKTEQARNSRAKRTIEIDGKTHHIAELQEQSGIDARTIWYRIQHGWPLERVLSAKRQYNNTESQKKAVQAHAEQKRSETTCKRGHLLSGKNLYLHDGKRMCRACRRAWDKFLYYGKTRPLEAFL